MPTGRVVRRIAVCATCGALTHSGATAAWPRVCRGCGRQLATPQPPAAALPRVRPTAPRRTWWTRERVLAGLRRFHAEHGVVPTSTEEWHRLTARRGARGGGPGAHRPYPSFYGVLRYFPTFRQAWSAAGVLIDRAMESWTELDDWYVREGTGLIPRRELARDLQRSADAVHRRLYDLGLHSYQRWGWTLHRVERVAQVPRHVLQTYLDRGDLPYLRGSKVIFVDPADLIVVREIDWERTPAELVEAARHGWRTRLVKVLAGLDWRAEQPHRAQPINRTDRRWGPRLVRPGPRPVGIVAGDWVRVAAPVASRPHCLGRAGLVHLVYFSFNRDRKNPARTTSEPQWIARVEFKSQGPRSRGPRVTYTLPLASLEPIASAPSSEETERACCAPITR